MLEVATVGVAGGGFGPIEVVVTTLSEGFVFFCCGEGKLLLLLLLLLRRLMLSVLLF